MTGYHIHHYFKDSEEEYKRKMPDRVLISRLLKYVLPHRKRLFIAVLAIITLSITNLLWPKLVQLAVDNYIIQEDFAGLSIIAVVFVIIKVINWVSGYFQRCQIYWIGQNILYKLRKKMFSKLQELSFSFYDRAETGLIISRVTNDTDSLREMLVQGAVDVFSQTLTLVLIIIMMLSMSASLTLVCMIIIPLLMGAAYVFRSKFKNTFRTSRRKIAKITSKLQEGILGIRETQSYTRETFVIEGFRQANMENLQANLQVSKLYGIFRPVIEIIGAIGIAVILLYGSSLYANGEITIGTLIAFPIYLQMFFTPIINLTLFYNTIQSAMAATERIFEVLDTTPEIKDSLNPIELQPLKGEVSFENITFGYDPNYPVLYNISFQVKPGKTLALVGPTGAGKSTIIKLLSRFYEPQSGTIKVDSDNIRKVRQKALRKQMGIVLQETFLFSDSVKENIRYGKLDATEEEIINAAKKVGAHEFITSLPNGYDTHVGEMGANLSVGQKQLIAFARALLRNPPIIILDEATSSIDPYTELIIKKSLSKMLRKRTSIVIAHRLSTVRRADEILVIDKGRIVEKGNHYELIKNGKFYRHLYEMQFKDI